MNWVTYNRKRIHWRRSTPVEAPGTPTNDRAAATWTARWRRDAVVVVAVAVVDATVDDDVAVVDRCGCCCHE